MRKSFPGLKGIFDVGTHVDGTGPWGRLVYVPIGFRSCCKHRALYIISGSAGSDRCRPFYQLLRRWKGFQWDEECEKAFQDLKEYLT